MAFTEQDQINLMYDIVGAVNASPGRTIYNDLAQNVIDNGATRHEIAIQIVDHPLFSGNSIGAYPISQTNEAFATEYLTNLIGARGDLVANALWDEAVNVVKGELNGGATRASVVSQAIQYLQNYNAAGFNAGFLNAAKALENKVTVALYQAVELELDIPSTDLAGFRAPLANVDETAGSVTAAKAALDIIADPTFELTATSPTVVEGDAGSAILVFGLTLDRPSTEAITVNYQTTGGTATSGSDYSIAAGQVTFGPGQTAATVSVTVNGDILVEGNETVTVLFSGAKLDGPVTATGTIINDDNALGVVTDVNGANGGVIAENAALGAAVGITASAANVDAGTVVTYSLTDDAGGRFAIDASTGVVTVAGALDRESFASHTITVKASSNNGTSSSSSFDIALSNVNDNPVSAISDTNAAGNSVSENVAAGASVGITASASDADVGATVTYSLSDDAGGKFNIDANTGVVTTAVSLDRESEASHTITVLATSSDGSANSRDFNILVNNVNEGPHATDGNLTTFQDNSVNGQIHATDDEGDTLTYTQGTGPSNGSLNLNGNGTFTYTPDAGFAGDDSFTVQVSDGNGGVDTATINVVVNDVTDILTVGVDDITLSGVNGQSVIGNDQTYNPGDSIVGSDGEDTLSLALNPAFSFFGTTISSANVSGIEIFHVTVNPGNVTPTVTLSMTNVDDALARVEIEKSLGHSISVTDLQNLPLIRLDDVSAAVNVDIDNQVVAGPADSLLVDVREFGSNSTSTFGRANLTVDTGIETLGIDDRALGSLFASDMTSVTGGYHTLNITGGMTGVDLTIQATATDSRPINSGTDVAGGVVSSFGTNILVDSTTFLGDLVADIDGARTGTVNTGVGNDDLIAHQDVFGSINTGAGADMVLLSTANLDGSIRTEGGADTVRVEGNLSSGSGALIDGGTEDDSITVTGSVGSTSSVRGGTGDDYVEVQSGVAGTVLGEDGDDTVEVSGGISGLVDGGAGDDHLHSNTSGTGGRVTGSILGQSGNDAIINDGNLGLDGVGFPQAGILDGGEGNDSITQNARMEEGSVINGGDGNDTITVNADLIQGDLGDGVTNTQQEASINGGAGDDLININAVLDGDIDAGTGDDTVIFSANHREGTVLLGEGDDHIMYKNGADFTGDAESGPYSGSENDGSVDGGAGNNLMTLRIDDDSSHNIEVASDGTPVLPIPVDATDIHNIQTLNIEAVDPDELVFTPANNQNFEVDLRAFDTTLETINVWMRDLSAIVDLGGYDSEIINVDSWSVNGSVAADVVLNVSTGTYDAGGVWLGGAIHGLNDSTETLTVNLNGPFAFQTTINDAAGVNVVNLSSNGSGARTVNLDSSDGDNNGLAAGEGNSLIISGDNPSRLTVNGISQEVINSVAHSGPVTLVIANDADGGNENLDIDTGDGDDTVNMVADVLNLGDDPINLGAGDNRLIINESTRFLHPFDEDFVFKNAVGINTLEVRGSDPTNGATPLQVSIEDDSREAGVRTIVVSNDDLIPGVAGMGNADIGIDADYLDFPGSGLELTVETRSGFVDITNGANVDNIVNLHANSGNTGNDGIATAAVSGSGVNFTNTGSGVVDVNITVSGALATPTIISSAGLNDVETVANPMTIGHVAMDVVTGGIDSLTLLDSTLSGGDNGAITLTWHDAWATGGILSVNAAGILDNDTDPGVFDGTHTGGLLFIGVAEDDVRFNLNGTQNDDVLWGGQQSDTIKGNDGDDLIYGDPAIGQVILPGVQAVKTIDFELADDVEAGDAYQITLGGRTYTWTAISDADTVQMAVTALVAAVNAGNGVLPAQVTATGDIDDADNSDDAAAADLGDGTIQITGTDEDSVFGYALGESFTSGEAINRPTATVTIVDEPYDIGDVVSITVDGTTYNAVVVGGLTPSTAESLAADLAAQIEAAAGVSAVAVGNVVEIRGDLSETKYMVSSEWSTDQLDVPATPNTVTIVYGDLEGGETASVTFGGITKAAATTAGLEALITGDGALSAWVADGTSVPGTLTLTAAVPGATPALPAVTAADIAGGDGGTATISSVAGTDFIDRTDNTDPAVAARATCFDLSDAMYDGGDTVVVTVNGVAYPFVLVGPLLAEDPNLDGAAAAAEIAAGLVIPGHTVTAAGSVVTVTAASGTTSTFAVSITDVAPVGPVAESLTIDYAGFVPAAGMSVNADFDGNVISGATVATLITNINLQTGTHGYTATPGPGVDQITLTAAATGVEPAVDKGDISANYESDGGAVAIVPVAAVAAVPQVETFTYGTIAVGDGADFTVGATLYHVDPAVDVATTLQDLADAINADTGVHGWTASVSGSALVFTGPSDGSDPGGLAGGNERNDSGDVETIGVATPPDETNGETYTVTLSPLVPGSITSFSISFDTDGVPGPSIGDDSYTATTVADMATLINTDPNGYFAAFPGELTATPHVSDPNILYVTGPAAGTGANQPPLTVVVVGTGGGGVVETSPADPTSNPWSQDFTVATLNAGEAVHIEFGDGTAVDVPWDTDVPTTLTALGTAINTALFGGAGVVNAPVGDTVTVDGPDDTTVPATTVDVLFAYTTTPDDGGVVTTPGAAAIAGMQTIDLSNWGPGETVTVTFGNGESFPVLWDTDLPTSMAAIEAAIEADGIENGDVNGAANWQDVSVAGSDLILTGPLDGTAPGIGLSSVVLRVITAVTPADLVESWENFDNSDPDLAFISGLPNTDSTDVTVVAPVPAPTAASNGNDSIDGGNGNDTIWGQGGNDILNGDAGNDVINGGAGFDFITGGSGDDNISGGSEDDTISGNDGHDTINGDSGNDSMDGGTGNDWIVGGTGNDTITGGDGDDLLNGGTGRDILTGGSGFDIFSFIPGDSTGQVGVTDRITDFVSGVDTIRVDATGDGAGSSAGSFVGNVSDTTNLLAALNAGGPVAGRSVYDSNAQILYVDVLGNGQISSALTIEMTGVASMQATDFHFV